MRDQILFIIRGHGRGISSYNIHLELERRSRVARWFGRDSILTALFGPSVGRLYVTLIELEEEGLVRSEWGPRSAARGGRRSRIYYPPLPNPET